MCIQEGCQKSSLADQDTFIEYDQMIGLVVFDDILTLVDYLKPNPVLYYIIYMRYDNE